MEDQKFIVRFVFELVGAPKEHIEEKLNELLEKIKKEPGVKVIEVKKGDPVDMQVAEGFKGLFSAFAGVEIEVDDHHRLLSICLDYTPSSVEILEPQSFKMDAGKYTSLLNDMLATLHKYSMYVANLSAEYKVLKKDFEDLKGTHKESSS